MENYIYKMIKEDMEKGEYSRGVCTRFPPEPNGYLHIGSMYAIQFNYNAAKIFNGKFNLRFDDTNPLKEDIEYVNAIIEDMKWMGYLDDSRIYFGSDYSDFLYDCAVKLIKKGLAYVCDLTQEELTRTKGSLTSYGEDSPYRRRSIDENLVLFEKMKNGEFENGSKTLRAKIDMKSPNMNMRDPVIYRIIHTTHYRTGNDWCIYPMYDYAHPLQDAKEGITHSLCSIEFRNHRPLYEWVLESLDINEPPRQREFGRINMTGVVTSKRYLKELVNGNYVIGWDDPRLPTIKGLRRRGYTKESIDAFINNLGASKDQSTVEFSLLDYYLRNDLKSRVFTKMAILIPLKVTLMNYDEHNIELLEIENNPDNEDLGVRKVSFGKHLFIEREDFMLEPTKGFKRLTLNNEVRLKGAYFVKCNSVIYNDFGEISELLCTYDPKTKSGSGFNERKPSATIQWVHCETSLPAEVRLFEPLFENDEIVKDKSLTWEEKINPNSLKIFSNAVIEASLEKVNIEDKFQFIRQGYFNVDSDTTAEKIVFNRIVPLKSSY